MNEDYSQPFCIIGSKGQFAESYQRRGYLPAIEPRQTEPAKTEASQVIEYRVIKTHDRQLTRKVLENERAIKYLLGKQKKPKKQPYYLKENINP